MHLQMPDPTPPNTPPIPPELPVPGPDDVPPPIETPPPQEQPSPLNGSMTRRLASATGPDHALARQQTRRAAQPLRAKLLEQTGPA